MKYRLMVLVALLLTGVALFFWLSQYAEAPTKEPVVAPEKTPTAQAEYVCNNQKTISAAFYENEVATSTPEAPRVNSVDVTLSDGRILTLNQTVSASGARYSNGDPQIERNETFIFWSKGNGAIVTDSGNEKSYFGCVAMAPITADLPNVYHDGQNGYTIRYANDWIVDPVYTYHTPNPDVARAMGVRFRIPPMVATGTNLSATDTGISVESIEGVTECSANTFTGEPTSATTTILSNVEYSVATSSGAGAGNFYEEHIYAVTNSQPCTAVRYVIHSTNIGNYEPGTKTEFDRKTLLKQFDTRRDTLITR